MIEEFIALFSYFYLWNILLKFCGEKVGHPVQGVLLGIIMLPNVAIIIPSEECFALKIESFRVGSRYDVRISLQGES